MGFLYNNFLSDFFCFSLNGIAGLVAEYAVAIIILTILIRLALMPIDIKMRSNQSKMADLKPQLENIQKRYANDPQQLQKKQKELYRKMGTQPLFGCLPLLLQLFILFAFFGAMRALQSEQTMSYALEAMQYGTANVDVSSFFWIHNLWQPDTVFPAVMPDANEFATFLQTNSTYITPQMLSMIQHTGLVDFSQNVVTIVEPCYSSVMSNIAAQMGLVTEEGLPIANGLCILPVLSGVSLFLSQKFGMQQNNDPQMAGTNKIMMYIMPAFSVWICFTSNAAFALYWTVSSLYAFAQGKIIMNVLERKKLKNSQKKNFIVSDADTK